MSGHPADETERVRRVYDHLADVGFAVEDVRRSRWGIVERVAARKRA